MFNIPGTILKTLSAKLCTTKNGINAYTNFCSPVHDHEMTGIFNSVVGFNIFDGKHEVIITVNMKNIGMPPVVFPVDGLVYSPVGIWQIYFPS